jgi:deazaflavin-dependent oxidoreductase (nitroreductase family)
MADWDPHAFTLALMADLRANDGVPSSGPLAGQHLLILTTKGAKTGEPRQAILTTTRDGDAYVVAGTKGGDPQHPSWFKNLQADPNVTIEADGKVLEAKAVVTQGAERDALWNRHVEVYPNFGEYPGKAEGRVIPMIKLEPIK